MSQFRVLIHSDDGVVLVNEEVEEKGRGEAVAVWGRKEDAAWSARLGQIAALKFSLN